MKKLLGAVIAAALLFPPGQASAELFKNLKTTGQLDMQGNAARNVVDFTTNADAVGTTFNDRIGNVLTRVMLGLDWDLLDDVHANVSLRKNDRAWGGTGVLGQGIGGGNGGTGNQSLIGNGNADAASNIYLQTANVKIDKLAGHFDTTLGRQFYGNAGDLVIFYGPQDNYGLFVTALDAFRVETGNDWVGFSGLAGKIAGGATLGTPQNDTNVTGFDLAWKTLPVKANTYVWNRVVHGSGALGTSPSNVTAVTGRNDNLWVYGVKVKGEAMGGWVSADLALNSGQDRTTQAGLACAAAGCPAASSSYQGKAVLLDAGWNADVANVGGFTPWVNFGLGTGRSDQRENSNEGFTSIASDYRPGIINRRFNASGALNLAAGTPAGGLGTNGLNNRQVLGAGVRFKPAKWEKLGIGASFWDYRLQKATALAATGVAAFGGAKHIGSEIGLTADWKHSDNVMTGIGWASFQPGSIIQRSITANGRGNNPATLAFADVTVKW